MSDRPRGPWDFDEPDQPQARARPGVRAWLWLLFVASLAGFVLALVRAFPDALHTPNDWANVGWAVGMLLLLSAGVARFGRGALTQHLKSAALWTALVAVLALGYAYRDVFADAPQRLQMAFRTGYPIAVGDHGAEHEVVVPQDARGAFVLNARVNGAPVKFMVDTGATDTVLSPQAAERLGVDLKAVDFKESAETANGMGYGAAYTATRLDVGPIAFADFPMVINQAPMSTSLLGLSFLNRLEDFEIRDRKLILKWREPAPAPAKPAPPAAAPPAKLAAPDKAAATPPAPAKK
jgi:aspartyl protease family protein